MIKNKLEEELYQEPEESWLRKAYRQEWPAMPNILVSHFLVAMPAAAGASYIASKVLESNAAISGIATATDTVTFWTAYFPLERLIEKYRKRKDNEHHDAPRRISRLAESAVFGLCMETAYIAMRFGGQYFLQKYGMEPAFASAAAQAGSISLFVLGGPLVRYALRQWPEK